MKSILIIIIEIMLLGVLNAQESEMVVLFPNVEDSTKKHSAMLREASVSDLEDRIEDVEDQVEEIGNRMEDTEYRVGELEYDVDNLYNMNPALRNHSIHETGYLVGAGYNSGEIRQTRISIEDVYAMMRENELLKRQIADLTQLYVSLSNRVELRGANTTLPAQFNLYVEHQNIVIENAQGELITVYRTDGTIAKSSRIANDNIIYIPVDGSNIYTVQVGANVTKVIVP